MRQKMSENVPKKKTENRVFPRPTLHPSHVYTTGTSFKFNYSVIHQTFKRDYKVRHEIAFYITRVLVCVQ